MPTDTLGDLSTYLRGSGLTLHVRYSGSRYVVWLTATGGETRALGSDATLVRALAQCVDAYEEKRGIPKGAL